MPKKTDEAVLASFRAFVYDKVKRSATVYEANGMVHDVKDFLPLYLQLQQIDQAERHFAEIRKRDDEWKEAIAERDRQILALQERYAAAEEQLVEVHRQHAQAIQEQQERALEDQDRLVGEHIQMIEEARQHPERFTVITGRHSQPMSLEEYESSATEP
jgi:DNA repair ATPase RecN